MLKSFFSLHVYRYPPEPKHTTNIEKVTVDVLRRLTSLTIIIATLYGQSNACINMELNTTIIHNWLIEV